jgi:hypothetical protein
MRERILNTRGGSSVSREPGWAIGRAKYSIRPWGIDRAPSVAKVCIDQDTRMIRSEVAVMLGVGILNTSLIQHMPGTITALHDCLAKLIDPSTKLLFR